MNIVFFMIPLALLLGFGFLGAFIWSVKDGQLDDVETPALRILNDERDEDE